MIYDPEIDGRAIEAGAEPAPEPAPPPVWEREIWRACDEDRRRYIVVSDEHEIAYFNGENCTCEEDAARATLAAAAPQMKRAGDALEALLVDDYWQSDRLAAARDAWRAASRKAEGGGVARQQVDNAGMGEALHELREAASQVAFLICSEGWDPDSTKHIEALERMMDLIPDLSPKG